MVAKLLRRVFEDFENCFISSTTLSAVVSRECKHGQTKIRTCFKFQSKQRVTQYYITILLSIPSPLLVNACGYMEARLETTYPANTHTTRTFLGVWSGEIHESRNGIQHSLFIATRQYLDRKLHPIIMDQILLV